MFGLLASIHVQANSTTSSSTSSSSTTQSTSSSSSNASRSSIIARQSSLNASRQAMQRAQQNTTRQNVVRNQQYRSTGQQKGRNVTVQHKQVELPAKYHPIVPVPTSYQDNLAPFLQYQITGYYNNVLFYQIISANDDLEKQRKGKMMSLDAQKRILKKQVKPGEKLYTLTIKTYNQQD